MKRTTKKPAKPRRERDIQAAVLAALRAHGVPAWKVGSGAFRVGGRFVKMGHKGMSDIIGIEQHYGGLEIPAIVGQFLAVEVKRPGGRLTLEQQAFLDTVNKAGGVGIVVHSVDELKEKMGWT